MAADEPSDPPAGRDTVADTDLGGRNQRADEAPLQCGTSIGRYVLLHPLGRGGMGIVYKAYDPELDRKVAVKVLHGGGGSRDRDSHGELRLVREARAMASLSHPNVVSVHDVGTFRGRVFIAMELVTGQSLTEWLDAKTRSWRDVVETFVRAGRGLAAAHTVGLVHRDFKPDNVLVGFGDGDQTEEVRRVCVTDFGLAHRVAGGASEDDRAGGSGQLRRITQRTAWLGTPAYMAPEQHLGADVDARTDQFSFCVALYEGLYGERPFAGQSVQALGVEVTSGHLRPPPRGTVVPPWLRKAVLRGLAPEPQSRWPSMDELLAALQADPARRRRRWIARTTVVASVVVAVGAVAWPTDRGADRSIDPCAAGADRLEGIWDGQRRRALSTAFESASTAYAQRGLDRLDTALDAWAKAWVAGHRDACEATHIRHEQSERLLDLRMGCLRRQRAEVEALVRVLIEAGDGAAQRASDALAAVPEPRRCAEVDQLGTGSTLPTDPALLARVEAEQRRLAWIKALEVAGRIDDGLAIARSCYDETRDLAHPATRAEAGLLLGSLLERAGEYAEAERVLDETEHLARSHRADRIAIEAGIELAYLVGYRQSRPADGLRWARHTRAEIARADAGPQAEARLANNEASILERQGKYEQALERFAEARRTWEQTLGPQHHRVASALNNMGLLVTRLGRAQQGETYLRQAVEIWRNELGADHPLVATALVNLGLALEEQSRHADAQTRYEEALTLRERVLGPEHPGVATCLNNLANVHHAQGRPEQARDLFERALAIRERAYGAEHPRTALVVDNLGVLARESGDLPRALQLHDRALRSYEQALGAEHPEVAVALENLGRVYHQQRRFDDALAVYRRALQIREAALGSEHVDVATAHVRLAEVLEVKGRKVAARRHYETALPVLQSKLSAEHEDLLAAQRALSPDGATL